MKKALRYFPLVPAATHALLTVWVFGAAVSNAERSGLLPVLIFAVDLPFSYIVMFVARLIPISGYTASLWRDMVFFLVLGSAWWYVIGRVFAVGANWLLKRREST